jgi:putative FmdB family regulatory protein
MPIYEYECDECQHSFEIMQSFQDDPIKICPNCQGHLHRVIQPVGIVFKGAGFYVTDNRRDGGNQPTKSLPAPSGNGQGKRKKQEKEPAPAASSTDSKPPVPVQAKED